MLPNAAGGSNQGFQIRMNRPRAFSCQLSAFSSQHKTVARVESIREDTDGPNFSNVFF
jgi:hypothetical protein